MSEESQSPAPTGPSSLSWMPIYVDDLLALAATLTPQQLGGLFRLRAYAWRQSPAATLPDSDARLAAISGLGAAWAEDGPAIREHLQPVETSEGRRLVDPWLAEVYRVQLNKYISAATRGGKGGRPSKAGGKAQLSGDDDGKQKRKQPEKLSLSSALLELKNPLSSVLSTSLEQNTEETKAGEKLSFPERSSAPELEKREREWLEANPGKRLPLNFHQVAPPTRPVPPADDPYRAADERVNSDVAKQQAEDSTLADEYADQLYESVERWRVSHDREYREQYIEATKALGLFGRTDVSRDQLAEIQSLTARRIRDAEGWPTPGEYIARRRQAVAV